MCRLPLNVLSRSTAVLLLTALSIGAAGQRPYFQQEVAYTITVRLDDSLHVLRGEETLVYRNNSTDTLRELYFHVWPNAYRDENTVLAKTYFNDNDLRFIKAGEKGRGRIDSLDFSVDGKTVSWRLLADTPDVAVLSMNLPILPGASVVVRTPFRMKYPSAGISRLGHGGQAYFTTQWYPKPAVYDRNGWNYFPYVDKGEYYGEFGSFDVSITLPENYRVAATGVLENGQEEYAWLDSLSEVTSRIDSFPAQQLGFPPSSGRFKTLRYRQDRVHDFAFFADKRWHVLKRTMKLPESGRNVDIYAFFTNHQGKWWLKAPEYMERAITRYSRWVGEYPYDKVSAADVIYAEGADMEYPMVTAIGHASNPYQLDAVLAHELGHNWFYGILGNNERIHPWLDEGVNSFCDRRYSFTTYAGDSATMNEYFNRMGRWGKWTKNTRMDGRLKQYYRYLADSRLNIDQPLTLRSEAYTLRNYSDMVYAKTSLGFQYLLQFLGDSLFDACMRQYYREWSFRHPYPEDMEEVFERVSGKDLDWLFGDWLATADKLDYSVRSLRIGPDAFEISLKNRGGIEGPVAVQRMDTDGKAAVVWINGFPGDTTVRIEGRPVLPHVIDKGLWIPEVNRKNNSVREGGLFRKIEPLQLRLLTGVENADRTQLYLAPAAGWNYSDGIMTGAVLHNVGYPQKNFQFAVMPMYAFGSSGPAGGGFINYRILPARGVLREIGLRSGFQRYSYTYPYAYDPTIDYSVVPKLHFQRLENSVTLVLRNPEPRNQVASKVRLRHLNILKETIDNTSLSLTDNQRNYLQAVFEKDKQDRWSGYLFNTSVTLTKGLLRCWLNGSRKFPYSNPGKGVEAGIGAGYLEYDGTTDYRFRLSGWNGNEDFLFDEVFPDRGGSTDLLGRQFVAADGGFATPTGYYRYAEHWMTVLHLKADAPGKLPLRFFFNMAAFDQFELDYNKDSRVSYEGGLQIDIMRDIFTVYVPLFHSKDLRNVIEKQDLNFGQLIRFELHLRKLNPLENLNR
jgi:hypothetical protein